MKREGRMVSSCTKVAAGSPMPRLSAQVTGGAVAAEYFQDLVKVVDSQGQDLSAEFIVGDQRAQ
jgi:uncharacterized protein YbbK (DUF523 family)